MKYLSSTTFGCKDIGIRKSEFVAKTQFLYAKFCRNSFSEYGMRKTSSPGDILKIQNTSLKLDFRNIRKTIEEDYIY